MPHQLLRDHIGLLGDDVQPLADLFGVSPIALERRLAYIAIRDEER